MTWLPWQSAAWERLKAYLRQERLPQALLVSGPHGIGKRPLVRRFAQVWLCEKRCGCGKCPACRLFEAGTHPDWIHLAPEEDKELTVDKIRELIAVLTLKPQYGQGRVVMIEASERMNPAAANSFLKTLEEPPLGTVLVLLSEAPGRLPATIRSRCQHLKLKIPPRQVALEWLKTQGADAETAELALGLNGGAPLAARDWLLSEAPAKRRQFLETWSALLKGHDPIVLAQKWQDESLEQILIWLLALTADLVRLSMGLKERLLNPDQRRLLQDQAKELNLTRALRFWQRLLKARQALGTQCNRALLLEAVFLAGAGLKA
ncbi:DNA polymerase III subunit delta' [Methylothermus subterraneus]